jgi:phosphatidylinositol alpha-1,6-mannosyltransferase
MPSNRGRALFLTSNFPRWEGDSTTPFVLHLAQDLQQLGWVVDVLAPAAPGAVARETIGSVSTTRFRYAWPENAQTVCYDGGALLNLRSQPRERMKLPALVGAEWWATVRRIIRNRYDVLNSHWILPQGFVGVMSAGPMRIPHVTTVHGGDIFSLQGRTLRPFKKLALRGSDAVTVNSSATARSVSDLVGSQVSPHLIPMGTDVGDPDPEIVSRIREKYRTENGPLLVFVGRLVPEKGVFDVLEALRMIQCDLPGATALIVGEGPSRETLKEFTDSSDLTGTVFFPGWIKPSEIVSYMAAGDFVLGPSKESPNGWIEAFGLTMVEAMASGTPLIATRSGGIPDLVTDGETGILVDPGNTAAITAAVKELVQNPDVAARIGVAARERARSRYSRETSAVGFSDLFERVIRDKHK